MEGESVGFDAEAFNSATGDVLIKFEGVASSRRGFIKRAACMGSLLGSISSSTHAAGAVPLSDAAWIQERLEQGDLTRKTNPKIDGDDIYYPLWMLGLWNVTSVTKSIQAPLGPQLFGRPGAVEAAQQEIGQPLQYQARFRRVADGRLVADRPFNVESISRAAMGEAAVLNSMEPDGNANRLTMTLVPSGAGGRVFLADLKVTARAASEADGQQRFICMETSKQSVYEQKDPLRGEMGQGRVSIPQSPTVSEKEIEVIQVFERVESEADTFRSTQRIATYLPTDKFKEMLRARALKGQTKLSELYQQTKTTPIDVRVYEITYKLVRKPSAYAQGIKPSI